MIAPPKAFDEVVVLDKHIQQQGQRAVLWDYTHAYFNWPGLAAGGVKG